MSLVAESDPPVRTETQARVLVADDEESVRFYLGRVLERLGHDVETAADGMAALEGLERRRVDLLLLDLKLPGLDGLEVLAKARARDPHAMVIMMTAYGTIRTAVQAMRLGAFDYLSKPFETEELELVVARALDQRRLLGEHRELKRLLEPRLQHTGLIGQSPALRELFATIDLMSESTATVLITGESGTGKEVLARAIHLGSPRAAEPFVVVNCAALPENLLENELFGHEAGAFTGAVEAKKGLVERAERGTLFLDQITELSLLGQVKLLRLLQEREYSRLGSSEPRAADVRVIATSSLDLEQAVAAGTFREDLYWRLNVVHLHVPPLRERREDIPPIALHCLAQIAREHGSSIESFSIEAMQALCAYAWPGNVRELKNVIERVVVLGTGRQILTPADLPPHLLEPRLQSQVPSATALDYRAALRGFEREYVLRLLERTGGNVSRAAQIAAMSRPNFHRKLTRLRLDPGQFRRGERADPPSAG